jgi:hypothetical protein
VGDLESGQGRNSGDLGSSSERNQRGSLLNYLKILEGIIENFKFHGLISSNITESQFLFLVVTGYTSRVVLTSPQFLTPIVT